LFTEVLDFLLRNAQGLFGHGTLTADGLQGFFSLFVFLLETFGFIDLSHGVCQIGGEDRIKISDNDIYYIGITFLLRFDPSFKFGHYIKVILVTADFFGGHRRIDQSHSLGRLFNHGITLNFLSTGRQVIATAPGYAVHIETGQIGIPFDFKTGSRSV